MATFIQIGPYSALFLGLVITGAAAATVAPEATSTAVSNTIDAIMGVLP